MDGSDEYTDYSSDRWSEQDLSPRELTAIVSTACVVLLLILGLCLFLCARCVCRRMNGNNARIISDSSGSSGGSSKEEKFRIVPHKNIFTPHQNFSFVVPTVQLTSQPREMEPSDQRLTASQPLLELTTVVEGNESKVPMLEQRFYPQLHQQGPPLSDGLPGPKIAISLFYSVSSQTLYVKIICGQNFPHGIPHCVKVKLYPGRSAKQRTRECEGIAPEFYEEFNFHVRKNVLHTKVLKLRVLGCVTVCKGNGGGGEEEKRLLGCANIPMTDLRGLDQIGILEDYRSGTMWRKLEQTGLSEGVKLSASLKWSPEPSPGLLTLKILQASGLHETTDSDYTSSYVKVTLQEQGKNMKARKTRLIRWGSIPSYDDTFVVTLPYQLLSQISFMLVIIARGRLGSKVVLGKISIGPVPYASPSSGAGTAFWEDMCHQPNVEILRCLPLHP